jgi:glycosyltransferase 2 family protein
LPSASNSATHPALVTPSDPPERSIPASLNDMPASAIAPVRGSWLRRHFGKTIGSLVIALAFIWALRRGGLPLIPSAQAFANVRWSLVAVHLFLLVVLHIVRAVRWRHLLRPIAPEISTRRVLAASWIGFTAILLLPLRAGEFVRPWLARDGKRITMSASLGTIGAERIIDGLFVTLILAGTLSLVPRLSPLPKSVGDLKIPVAAIPAAGYVALAVFVVAFAAMALFYFARGFARRLVFATIGRISTRMAEKMASIVEGIADGLHFLAGPRYALPFLFETSLYWLLNATLMWVLGIACGLPMNFGHACAVMGVLAVGILVPAGPGLFGAFQAATYGALAMYFAPDVVTHAGAAYVFLLYAVQFVWHLVAACIAALLEPSLLRGEPT